MRALIPALMLTSSLLSAPAAAEGNSVILHLPSEKLSIFGTAEKFDGAVITLNTALGPLHFSYSKFICTGTGCPKAEPLPYLPKD